MEDALHRKHVPPESGGWTLDTVVYHFEARIDHMQEFYKDITETRERAAVDRLEAINKQIVAAQKASDDAVRKAEAATEKRLDNVNEFRQQLTDQTKTFAGKSETDVRFDALDKRLEKLEAVLLAASAKGQGAMAVGNVVLAVVAGLASLAVVVDLFLRR